MVNLNLNFTRVQVVLLNLQEADMCGADYRAQECARQFFAHVNNLDSTSSIKASGCLPHLNSNRWEQKLQDGIIGSIHLCDDPIKPLCHLLSKGEVNPIHRPFSNIHLLIRTLAAMLYQRLQRNVSDLRWTESQMLLSYIVSSNWRTKH